MAKPNSRYQQALGERLILSGVGILSSYNDGNQRSILGVGVQFRVTMTPLFKIKYFFAYGDYSDRAQDLAPSGSAPPYAAFQSISYHSWGVVLEKNWGSRAKFFFGEQLHLQPSGGQSLG